jgi:hypothetical protein
MILQNELGLPEPPNLQGRKRGKAQVSANAAGGATIEKRSINLMLQNQQEIQ